MKHELTLDRKIIASLKHIVSKDKARYTLMGISLRCLNGLPTFTATNGKSLVSIQGNEILNKDIDVIIPTRIPHRLCTVIIDDEAKTITYKEPGCETILPLIDSKYPNYLKVVPNELGKIEPVTLSIHLLEDVMKSAKAYGGNKNGLYCHADRKDASIFALDGCPEWFGMLMPIRSDVTIPSWLTK